MQDPLLSLAHDTLTLPLHPPNAPIESPTVSGSRLKCWPVQLEVKPAAYPHSEQQRIYIVLRMHIVQQYCIHNSCYFLLLTKERKGGKRDFLQKRLTPPPTKRTADFASPARVLVGLLQVYAACVRYTHPHTAERDRETRHLSYSFLVSCNTTTAELEVVLVRLCTLFAPRPPLVVLQRGIYSTRRRGKRGEPDILIHLHVFLV